uniref:Uncharacterized protein n=1 Tax=Populus alba TaxID=43335 RepID=A0A4V6XVL2_POPAL|nr:hypothetical protein D5086_0000325120 [Populus alba]
MVMCVVILKRENILLVSSKRGGTGAEYVQRKGILGLAKRAEMNKKRKFDPYLRGTALYMAPESVADHVQEAPSWMHSFRDAYSPRPLPKNSATTKEFLRKIGDELPEIPP